jgi:hypothetical protein
MAGSLNSGTILGALAALARHLKLQRDVEILLVGGSAGVLINALPADWTTADVDTIHFRAAEDRDAVLDAAEAAGHELSLPADWLNDWGGLFAWTLPDDWESRRVFIGTFGRLRVYAVSRQDLIAMKFIAHRPGDLEHLERMDVTHDDLEFVRRYLNSLADRYPPGRHPVEAGTIAMARQYADAWNAI